MRGYFEIGIVNGKTVSNMGTLWRTAYQLGAAGIFTIGQRYQKHVSDTCKSYRHVPLRFYRTLEEFASLRPDGAVIVGVEMGGVPLSGFHHPQQAIYLLGAEDKGLPDGVMQMCDQVVALESLRQPSYNVAVAGTIVLYHRVFLS